METVIERIKRHEGLILKVYKDSLGVPTIGYGRNLRDKGITPEEAEILFNNDITEARANINKHMPWASQMDDARWGVLLEMVFQLGIGGVLQFKNTLRAMEQGDYTAAAAGMLNSLWAKQTPSRVKELAQIMAKGEA